MKDTVSVGVKVGLVVAQPLADTRQLVAQALTRRHALSLAGLALLGLALAGLALPAHAQDDPICPQPTNDRAALNRVYRERQFYQRETERLRVIIEGLIDTNLEREVVLRFQNTVIECWKKEAQRPTRSKVDVCGTLSVTH